MAKLHRHNPAQYSLTRKGSEVLDVRPRQNDRPRHLVPLAELRLPVLWSADIRPNTVERCVTMVLAPYQPSLAGYDCKPRALLRGAGILRRGFRHFCQIRRGVHCVARNDCKAAITGLPMNSCRH
jgi:hypothetical protein